MAAIRVALRLCYFDFFAFAQRVGAAINRPLSLLRPLLSLAPEEWNVLDAVPRIKLESEPKGRLS